MPRCVSLSPPRRQSGPGRQRGRGEGGDGGQERGGGGAARGYLARGGGRGRSVSAPLPRRLPRGRGPAAAWLLCLPPAGLFLLLAGVPLRPALRPADPAGCPLPLPPLRGSPPVLFGWVSLNGGRLEAAVLLADCRGPNPRPGATGRGGRQGRYGCWGGDKYAGGGAVEAS